MNPDKNILRQQLRTQRKEYSLIDSLRAGEKLLQNLTILLNKVNKIAIYHACAGEISLKPVIEYLLAHGKAVYRPVAIHSSKILRFEQIFDSADLPMFVTEDYQVTHEILCQDLDLILMPLLAVDLDGYRLGQGGGYYDATLSTVTNRPILCGVGYAWQLLNSVPRDEWDIPLDYFTSDLSLRKF